MPRARPKPADLPTPEDLLGVTKEPDFRQERSRRSYLALLEAAAVEFAKRGYDATGTPEIAEAAGVSVGTFYRYFEDKHAIYVEIARRTMAAAYRASIENLEPQRFFGRGRGEAIAVVLDHAFDNLLAHPDLSRSFTEMALRDADIAALRRALEELSTKRLAQLIAAVVPRATIPDPEATALVLYTMVMETAYSLVRRFEPPDVEIARIKATLAMFVERTLFPGA